MSGKKASARQRAEAERLEAARQARRRERRMRVGIAAAVLVVVAVVGVVLVQRSGPSGTGAVPEAAVDDGSGVAVGEASAPVTIDYWFDFQCPYCGEFEAENGDVLAEVVEDGTARVVYHPAAFLGDESDRAANAFGCAVDAGRPVDYLRELFAHQPAEGEGGYTEDDLLERGAAVGLTGSGFESCVTGGTYADWGATVLDAMRDHGIEQTPAVLIDGEPVQAPADISATDFRAAIDEAVTSS